MGKYKEYKIEIILLIFSFLIVFISFFLSLSYENKFLWFQRSGSIMVLFGIIIEYKLNNIFIKNFNKKMNIGIHKNKPILHKNKKEYNNVEKITHIFLIIGTLIWGYGDLLITLINLIK